MLLGNYSGQLITLGYIAGSTRYTHGEHNNVKIVAKPVVLSLPARPRMFPTIKSRAQSHVSELEHSMGPTSRSDDSENLASEYICNISSSLRELYIP